MSELAITVFFAAAAGGAIGVLITLLIYEKFLATTQNWNWGRSRNNIGNIGIRKRYDQ